MHRLFLRSQVLPAMENDLSPEYDSPALICATKFRLKQPFDIRDSSDDVAQGVFQRPHHFAKVNLEKFQKFLRESHNAHVIQDAVDDNIPLLSILKRRFKFEIALICSSNLLHKIFATPLESPSTNKITRLIVHCPDLTQSSACETNDNREMVIQPDVHLQLIHGLGIQRLLVLRVRLDNGLRGSVVLASARSLADSSPSSSLSTLNPTNAAIDFNFIADAISSIEDRYEQRCESRYNALRNHCLFTTELMVDVKCNLSTLNVVAEDTYSAWKALTTGAQDELALLSLESSRDSFFKELELCLQKKVQANAALGAEIDRAIKVSLNYLRCAGVH